MPSPASLLIWLIGGPILIILLIGIMEFGGYALFDMRIKGALEASAKAATSQVEWVYASDIGGKVPVLDPISAMSAAQKTWNQNVNLWGRGIWSSFKPQFIMFATLPNTPYGDYDTLYATIKMQFPMSLFNNFLSQFHIQQSVQQKVVESASSTVQAAINTANAIKAAQNVLIQRKNLLTQMKNSLNSLKPKINIHSTLPTPQQINKNLNSLSSIGQ